MLETDLLTHKYNSRLGCKTLALANRGLTKVAASLGSLTEATNAARLKSFPRAPTTVSSGLTCRTNLLRVKAALPKQGQRDLEASFADLEASFAIGILTVDFARQTAMIGEAASPLTTGIYIHGLLLARAGKICSYSSLVRQVLGTTANIQNLRNYISNYATKSSPTLVTPVTS